MRLLVRNGPIACLAKVDTSSSSAAAARKAWKKSSIKGNFRDALVSTMLLRKILRRVCGPTGQLGGYH